MDFYRESSPRKHKKAAYDNDLYRLSSSTVDESSQKMIMSSHSLLPTRRSYHCTQRLALILVSTILCSGFSFVDASFHVVKGKQANRSYYCNNSNNNYQYRHSKSFWHTSSSTTATTRLFSAPPLVTALASTDASTAVSLKHMEYSASPCNTEKRPPAIFLHGLLGNKRNFSTIGRSLSAQLDNERRVLGLDLRNHGENHHDWRDEMHYKAMAADVIQFLDENNLDRVELVGHSVGGKVAQAVALLQPERVEGLAVIDIAPVTYTNDEPHWKAVVDIIDSLRSIQLEPGMNRRDVDKQLQKFVADPALRAFCLTNYDQKSGQWTVHLESIGAQLEQLAGFDIDADSQFSGDAFFIHGGQSRFVRHKHIDTIASHFPNHMLTTIRGAGHWVHAEAPEDTTALLKRFLDR